MGTAGTRWGGPRSDAQSRHLLHGSGIPPPLYTPAQAEDQSELMDSPEIKGFAVTTQQVL